MIKTGIYGAEHPRAAELVKILLHHPDVDVRWLCANSVYAGSRADAFHPLLTAETDLAFISSAPLGSVDAVFLCGTPEENRYLLTTVPEIPPALRIIDVTGNAGSTGPLESGFVYGLPELNRKALVRGATMASLPSPLPYAISLSLLPLAKNLLLNSPVRSAAVISRETIGADRQSAIQDNLMFLADTAADAENEIAETLRMLQNSFCSQVTVVPVAASHSRGMMAVTETSVKVDIREIVRLYHEFFDDHNFITIVDSEVTLDAVKGTNKALINLVRKDDRLIVTLVMDDSIKGSAGTAVHVMNLLFGLSEKTGLVL